jgi:phage tail-like protein
MDANGTRFHLLLGEQDWARCSDDSHEAQSAGEASTQLVGLGWDPKSQEQTLRALSFHFVAGPTDRAPTLEDRRGAARDRYGNWYWIDADRRRIRVKSAGSAGISDFWPVPGTVVEPAPIGSFRPTAIPAAPPSPQLAGLAVTAHHYLLVGTVDPAGFLLFDLHAGGPPQTLTWPSAIPLVPFDMAPLPEGGVCVLDRTHRRFWLLDARFHVRGSDPQTQPLSPSVRDDFQPQAGGPERKRAARVFPLGVALGLATPIPASDPIAIEVLPDASILVLDLDGPEGDGRVFHFDGGKQLGPPQALRVDALLADGQSVNHSLKAHDFAFVPGSTPSTLGQLYVAPSDGNQAFSFSVSTANGSLSLQPIVEYLPMRLFQGKALVGGQGGAYYDHPGGFVPLVEQKRPRYTQEGVLTTPPLDGREPDCVWHRLLIDGRIPEGARVEVWSRAANDPTELTQLQFLAEPELYRRGNGPELPFLSREALGDRHSYELLLQRARGRYLQLRLVLGGDGRVTPRLRALRAWYPRFSYLERYLPGAYREDAQSASFLERFLSNPEGFFTALEDRIAGAHALLDVRSAPSDALEWLASWFGVALDPAWDEARRRLFIRHAMDFFQFRGTVRGLRMALRLALDCRADESIFSEPDDPLRSAVRIVERFRARGVPAIYAGDPSDEAGVRFVPPDQRWTPDQQRETLEQRWQRALTSAGRDAIGPYPLREPEDTSLAGIWSAFSRQALGFIPRSSGADAGAWREFLASRYRNVASLNQAYGSALPDFNALALPTALPQNGAPLRDWYHFESIVQPMRQTAHRFRVLIPTSFGAGSAAERASRLELAARIVELEKPAHTAFDLRFYYAMFRVGEARLGFDSLVDLGGRAPELMTPFVLGPTHLAEGYLAARPPADAPDRRVLGRDRLDA